MEVKIWKGSCRILLAPDRRRQHKRGLFGRRAFVSDSRQGVVQGLGVVSTQELTSSARTTADSSRAARICLGMGFRLYRF